MEFSGQELNAAIGRSHFSMLRISNTSYLLEGGE